MAHYKRRASVTSRETLSRLRGAVAPGRDCATQSWPPQGLLELPDLVMTIGLRDILVTLTQAPQSGKKWEISRGS